MELSEAGLLKHPRSASHNRIAGWAACAFENPVWTEFGIAAWTYQVAELKRLLTVQTPK
jgi:hypothetical protein